MTLSNPKRKADNGPEAGDQSLVDKLSRWCRCDGVKKKKKKTQQSLKGEKDYRKQRARGRWLLLTRVTKSRKGEMRMARKWKINGFGERREGKKRGGTALFVVVSALCRSWMPGWSVDFWYNYLTWCWPLAGNPCHLVATFIHKPLTVTFIFSMAAPAGSDLLSSLYSCASWQTSCFY